jgi:hypothetical protein
MSEDTNAVAWRYNAERSAVLADALRPSDRLPRNIRLQVHGESMLPALWPGDMVEIASCRPDDLIPGEIVLALRSGLLFLHRLVAVNANGFTLRGDSMPGCDPFYSREMLLGRLVRKETTPHSWLTVKKLSGKRLNRKKFSAMKSSRKWSRAVGWLLCHCGVVRRLALRLHNRRQAWARELPSPELS